MNKKKMNPKLKKIKAIKQVTLKDTKEETADAFNQKELNEVPKKTKNFIGATNITPEAKEQMAIQTKIKEEEERKAKIKIKDKLIKESIEDFNKIISYLKTLTKLSNTQRMKMSNAFLGMANIHKDYGKPETALNCVNEAIDYNPNNVEAYLLRANVKFLMANNMETL